MPHIAGETATAWTADTLLPHLKPCLAPPGPIETLAKRAVLTCCSVPAVGTAVPMTSLTVMPATPCTIRPVPGVSGVVRGEHGAPSWHHRCLT